MSFVFVKIFVFCWIFVTIWFKIWWWMRPWNIAWNWPTLIRMAPSILRRSFPWPFDSWHFQQSPIVLRLMLRVWSKIGRNETVKLRHPRFPCRRSHSGVRAFPTQTSASETCDGQYKVGIKGIALWLHIAQLWQELATLYMSMFDADPDRWLFFFARPFHSQRFTWLNAQDAFLEEFEFRDMWSVALGDAMSRSSFLKEKDLRIVWRSQWLMS